MSTDNQPEAAPSREWVLNPETEYRFELDVGTTLAIKVLRGQAEIFGAELVEGKTYLFYEECKAAVFTWIGCTIEMSLQIQLLTFVPPLSNSHRRLHYRSTIY
ncbi:Cleavage polyadenylation factor subunit clp1 [Cerrena zonata]|uniref:Cleavage polyadenylation factor subunit clp1 n=1 Tax=Cerrena zonata TaxID=2478898 RepID=A0AAW0GS15_9APHY